MADKTSTLRIQLVDDLSGKARKTAEAINNIGKAVDATGRKRALFGMDPAALRNLRTTMQFQERMARQRAAEEAASRAADAAKLANLRTTMAFQERMLRQRMSMEAAAARAAEAQQRRMLAFEREVAELAKKRHAAVMRARQEEERIARARSFAARAGRAFEIGSSVATGVVAGGAVLARPLKKALDYDQTLTYMAVTAASGGTKDEKAAAKKMISDRVDAALKASGGTREGAAKALNTLIASGQFTQEEALAALPTVLKASVASGSDEEDIAKTAVGMRNAGVAVKDLELGFDYMTKAGQLGAFELRDMARWMNQQLAMARGAGFRGLEAVKQLSAYNQIMMKTAGTQDEAGNNLVNLLQKLNSTEIQDRLAKLITPEKGDPTFITGKGKKKARAFDFQGYLMQQQARGINPIEAIGLLLERQMAGDKRYQRIKAQIADAKTPEEKAALLERAKAIAEGSAVGRFLSDRQALLGLLAVLYGAKEKAELDKEISQAQGTVTADHQFVMEQPSAKAQAAQSRLDRANEEAFNQISGPLGNVLSALNNLAEAFPKLTAAVYGAAQVLGAIGAAGVTGLIVGRAISGGAAGAAAAGAGSAAAGSAGSVGVATAGRALTGAELARARAGVNIPAAGAGAGGSLIGKLGAGLKGGLLSGAAYLAGTYAIDGLFAALPKPAYPPGYDPKAEMDKGVVDRVKELIGLKERYQPPADWNNLPAMQRRIDEAWNGGVTTEQTREMDLKPSPELRPTAPLPPERPKDMPRPKAIAPEPATEEAQKAAQQTMDAFTQALEQKTAEAKAVMARLMAELQQMVASTPLTPTIRPRIDGSALRAVHADTGVD